MSESRAVPHIVLPRHLPAPIRFWWSCPECPFQVSGYSEDAVVAAMDAHATFVNQTKDRGTDPHFADVRLQALIGS